MDVDEYERPSNLTLYSLGGKAEFVFPVTGLILPHFCACPKPGPGFPTSYVMFYFFIFNDLRSEMIVRDILLILLLYIVGSHCSNFFS
jgi:hypothetical protein